MYTNVDDALSSVDVAVKETIADQPGLAEEADSVYWDLAQAIMWECDVSTARELARVTGVSPIK
jgi:hypothetical protein